MHEACVGQLHPGSGTDWADAVDRPEGKRHLTQTASCALRAGAVLPSLPVPRLSSEVSVISAAGVVWPMRVLNTCDLYIDFLQM